MQAQWFLETIGADGSRVTYVVATLPYRIGRDPENELTVNAMGLSRRHAELMADVSGRLRLVDLDSLNGTYVNRARISGSQLLSENDVIHFGNAEFRLKALQSAADRPAPYAEDNTRTVMALPGASLSEYFSPLEHQFMAFLGGQGLTAAIQPIVHAQTSELFAYELLGRCKHPELPPSPIHLFRLANQLKREVELSEAFRSNGIREVAPKIGTTALFVNTHPDETFQEKFFESLRMTLKQWPGLNLVVEIHETAVMETERMQELAARLRDIGVRFAYDDFGAGQARLNELGECPADFIKFDMALIRGIDTANERKRHVVGDLVKLVHDLGAMSLAEGVETEGEAEVCRAMGFHLIQGYLTGRPVMVDSL